MAFWNISAGTADSISQKNGLPANVNNDAGTIKAAGAVASTRFQATNLVQPYHFVTIVSGVDNRAVREGTFNNNADITIMGQKTDLAGNANTELSNSASNSANLAKSIKQIVKIKTRYVKTAIREKRWDEYNGVWLSGDPTVANRGAWSIRNSNDGGALVRTSGIDDAANPTRLVPGELQYHDGSKTIKQDDYKERSIF